MKHTKHNSTPKILAETSLAAAVTLASLGLPALNASAETAPTTIDGISTEVISGSEATVSQSIADQIPVTFAHVIAYNPTAKGDFFIENPLVVSLPNNQTLIGYVQNHGGPGGPGVYLYPFDFSTTSLYPNPDSQSSLPLVSEVVFPSTTNPWDLGNPVNAANGQSLLNTSLESLPIGVPFFSEQ